MPRRNRGVRIENFSSQQKTAINNIIRNAPDFSCQGKLGKFLTLYLTLESLARKIYQYKFEKEAPISLYYNNIATAFKGFGIVGSDTTLIEKIFRSSRENLRGNKTPRQLRNPIIHNLSVKDIEEVIERFPELSNRMELLLQKIKNKLD